MKKVVPQSGKVAREARECVQVVVLLLLTAFRPLQKSVDVGKIFSSLDPDAGRSPSVL
jgi:hypothetical protein